MVPQPSSGRDISGPDPERRLSAKVEPQLPNWLEPEDEDVDPLEGASDEEEEFRFTREWVPLVQCATESDFYYGRSFTSFDDLAACRLTGCARSPDSTTRERLSTAVDRVLDADGPALRHGLPRCLHGGNVRVRGEGLRVACTVV